MVCSRGEKRAWGRGTSGPLNNRGDEERSWQCNLLRQGLQTLCWALQSELAGPSWSPCLQRNPLIHRTQAAGWWCTGPGSPRHIPEEGGPWNWGTLASPITSPPPISLPACGLGQVFVVEDNFSSLLGLAGPGHFWGGAATVEGKSASDSGLDHCLPLLLSEQNGGSVERVGRPRSGCKTAGPVGTFLGGTGSGP